jgi:hypothetical protein
MEDRAFTTADTKEMAQPITADETNQLSKHLNEFPILNTPVSSTPLPTVSPTGIDMLKMLGYVD